MCALPVLSTRWLRATPQDHSSMSSMPDSLWPLLMDPLKTAHHNALKIEITTVYPARPITRGDVPSTMWEEEGTSGVHEARSSWTQKSMTTT